MLLKVLRSTDDWTKSLGDARKSAVVAVGNFDGMHRGHQEILRRVIERARSQNHIPAVLTFYPHPARVLRPSQAPALLLTLDQRLREFEACGLDAALIIGFDAQFAKLSAEDFTKNILVDTMLARSVMVGGNFRFGHRQLGDVKMLEQFGARWGFSVEVVPPVLEDGVVISSTTIRNTLSEGRVDYVQGMLGHPFYLQGEIETGSGIGRELVVPTLNLCTQQEALPKNGVYVSETVVNQKPHASVTNVGVRPTFGANRTTVESFLFDFHDKLTSGALEVRFLARIRDEKKFSGPVELKKQITSDIQEAKAFWANRGGAAANSLLK